MKFRHMTSYRIMEVIIRGMGGWSLTIISTYSFLCYQSRIHRITRHIMIFLILVITRTSPSLSAKYHLLLLEALIFLIISKGAQNEEKEGVVLMSM